MIFQYTVTVATDTHAHAEQVIAERTGYDEEYRDSDGRTFVYALSATESSPRAPLSNTEADEAPLGDLIELAARELGGYHSWTRWLEDYYDPAKAALVELLAQEGVIK